MLCCYAYEIPVEGHRPSTDVLLCLAWQQHCRETGTVSRMHPVIRRTDNGKPFFPQIPVFLSVSHSGQWWICVFSDRLVGVDIQKMTAMNWERISRRYFTPAEQIYCNREGKTGFFRIWTRKEAIVKLRDSTLGKCLSTVNTLEQQGLHYMEVELDPSYCCTIATSSERKPLCVRFIR